MKTNEKNRYAFIFSNWYSGATLLAILLNNHCQMTCNGETFPFRPSDLMIYRCSCGMDLTTCKFYRIAAAHMLHGAQHSECTQLFAVLPEFSRIGIIDKWLKSFNYLPKLRDWVISTIPSYRGTMRSFVEAHRAFYSQSCLFEGSSLYIDGTKSFRRAELFAQHDDKPFSILYLIRDGRGFCWSFLKNRKLPKKRLPQAMAAWKEHIRMVDRFARRYTEIPILTIRYEDLSVDAKKFMRQITEFLKVPYDTEMLKENNREYHVLGNVMRKQFNWCIREDLSWEIEFSRSEIDIMTHQMLPELKRFGYLN